MSAKHKRPFYVFAAVAAVCCMVLANGIRGQADGGAPLIAQPVTPGASASDGPLPNDPAPSSEAGSFLSTIGGPGGVLESLPGPSGTELPGDSLFGDGVLTSSGSGAFSLPELPTDLGDELSLDPDDVDSPALEHEVRTAGETRRGPQVDDDKGKDEKEDEQPGGGTEPPDAEPTDGDETESNVDPMSEDEDPADGGAGGQDQGGDQGNGDQGNGDQPDDGVEP